MFNDLDTILPFVVPALSLLGAFAALVPRGAGRGATLVPQVAALAALVCAVWWALDIVNTSEFLRAPGPPFTEASMRWFAIGDAQDPTSPYLFTSLIGCILDNLAAFSLVGVALIGLLIQYFLGAERPESARVARRRLAPGLIVFGAAGMAIANDLMMIALLWQMMAIGAFLLATPGASRAGGRGAARALVGVMTSGLLLAAAASMAAVYCNTSGLGGIVTAHATANARNAGEWWWLISLLLLGAAIARLVASVRLLRPDDAKGLPYPVPALCGLLMLASPALLLARIQFVLTPVAFWALGWFGLAFALACALRACARADVRDVVAMAVPAQAALALAAFAEPLLGAPLLQAATLVVLGAGLICAAHVFGGEPDPAVRDVSPDGIDKRRGRSIVRYIAVVCFAVVAAAAAGVPFTAGFAARDLLFASAIGRWVFELAWLKATSFVLVAFTCAVLAFALARTVVRSARPADGARSIGLRAALPLLLLALLCAAPAFAPAPLDTVDTGLFRASLADASSVRGSSISTSATVAAMNMGQPPRKLYQGRGVVCGVFYHFRSITDFDEVSRPYRIWVQAGIGALGLLLASAFAWRGAGRGRLMRGAAWIETNTFEGIANRTADGMRGLARAAAWFDAAVLDGASRFLAGLTQFLGLLARQLHTGHVQQYVLIAAVTVIALFFLLR